MRPPVRDRLLAQAIRVPTLGPLPITELSIRVSSKSLRRVAIGLLLAQRL
jgi:hypothetical protein